MVIKYREAAILKVPNNNFPVRYFSVVCNRPIAFIFLKGHLSPNKLLVLFIVKEEFHKNCFFTWLWSSMLGKWLIIINNSIKIYFYILNFSTINQPHGRLVSTSKFSFKIHYFFTTVFKNMVRYLVTVTFYSKQDACNENRRDTFIGSILQFLPTWKKKFNKLISR